MNSLEIRLKYGREDLYVSIPNYLLEFIAQSKKEVRATLNDINKVLDGFMFQINKVKDKILKKGLLLLLSDHTRAVPNKKILPLILNKLHDNGFKDDNIRFLIAYGLHKKITDKDVKDFFGIDPNEYTVLHHDATNEEELIALGKTSLPGTIRSFILALRSSNFSSTFLMSLSLTFSFHLTSATKCSFLFLNNAISTSKSGISILTGWRE